jgi:hypothetical protein
MMDLTLQVVIGLLCVPLLALGIKSMFAPGRMLDDLAIDPRGVAGLSTVRGVVGGLFLSCVAMLVLGLVQHQTVWFLAAALVMGVAAVGRLVSLAADGYESAVLRPLVVEIVIVFVLVGAHIRLGSLA